METISVRVLGMLLAAAMIASCNGGEIGNCAAIYPHAQFCWEGVTRDSCRSQDGQFSSLSCFEQGFGCPDVQQFQAPQVCAQRCSDANLHLASCGIGGIDCSVTASLGYTSCVTACATAKTCEELQTDPLAACNAYCGAFDAGLPDRP
jgi:hypothetical protein